MIEQNLDSDRQYVEVALHLVAESFYLQQSRFVFLGGDDEFGRGQGSECLVDQFHILFAERMMVAEGLWCHLLGIGLQFCLHLLRRGNARE